MEIEVISIILETLSIIVTQHLFWNSEWRVYPKMALSCKLNARQILCFMVFWGQIQNYVMRTNLSIVIVAMVKENSENNIVNFNANLTSPPNRLNGLSPNISAERKEEDIHATYNWSPSLQGIILA